jgi:SAM-dependent methyltransferase
MGKNNSVNITVNKKLLPFKAFHHPDRPFMNLTPVQSGLVSDFNRKASEGLIEFESVPCLCGSVTFDLIASIDRYSMSQKTVMCMQCGLVQSNPRMSNEEFSRFYSSDMYRLCYEGEDYLSIYESRYDIKCSRHIFDEIVKVRPVDASVSVAELGAGGGWNLVPFVKAGARATGIDYSKSLTELGRNHGLDMKQGGADDLRGSYDIIIINHALEHFCDPVGSLRKIARHLNRNGLLYIAVPNILNFGVGQLQNAHVYYFTPETFEYYCAKAGLKPLTTGTAQEIHMFGIFTAGAEVACPDIRGHRGKMMAHFRKEKLKHIVKAVLSGLNLYKDRSVS